ncbi:HupE/UreJ family protein [Marinomonas fungiae]|uniref:HupE/UreJ family protein n=1 Tax=Marinomonas fungiae TaxID=1137284 RepID=UPI003A8EE581
MRLSTIKIGFLALLLTPSLALAHPGHEHTSSFLSGLTHPLTGLDHLLAMFAIGLWAASLGGRALFVVPAMFVVTMILGAVAAMYGISVPFVESGILLSVMLLGVLLLIGKHLPTALAASLAGAFALFHGVAHGMEMPLSGSGLEYGLGFSLATIALHLVGVGVGQLLRSLQLTIIGRISGAAIGLAGLVLTLA